MIYRYIPEVPGKLALGGRLQALAIKDSRSFDTRNWGIAPEVLVGQKFLVEWVDLRNTDSPSDNLRLQGFANGCARFAAGEGMWYAGGAILFCCTGGGRRRNGQIWQLTPSAFWGARDEKKNPGYLELFFEPNNADLLGNGDNLTVSPSGDIYVCEDNSYAVEIVSITPNGQPFKFAKNAMNNFEFAGATFSPDGSTLFVNIQKPGFTRYHRQLAGQSLNCGLANHLKGSSLRPMKRGGRSTLHNDCAA